MPTLTSEIEKERLILSVMDERGPVWPILRWEYYFRLIYGGSRKKPVNKIRIFRETFYGFWNWFSGCDVICFSDSEQSTRRLIEGKYYDRFVDPIIDLVGPRKCLLIEIPSPTHYPRGITHTKKIVSVRPIEILSRIITLLASTPKINNRQILNEIKTDKCLEINDEKTLKKYYSRKMVYRWLYATKKPRVVFLQAPYSDLARVTAAKELGITVVEVQHGIIGKEHPAYNTEFEMPDSFIPDYLLSFGKYEKKLDDSFIYSSDRVVPVGSYYLDYINEKYNPEKRFAAHVAEYKRSVAVTLQKTILNEVIDFIVEAAKIDESILYFLIPREGFDIPKALPRNVEVLYEPNFYELMKYVDFHVTGYSSCAIEAPSMGVQNILIDIGGHATTYYGSILTNENITAYIREPKTLVEVITKYKKLDRLSIIKSNSELFSVRYLDNLRVFLRKLHLIN